jgi:serine/threonine-protein kinase RsbW
MEKKKGTPEEPADREGPISLTIPGDLQHVPPLRKNIAEYCTKWRFSEEEILEIQLAATEILNNAIEHGSGNGEDTIAVRFEFDGSSIIFSVKDRGTGPGQITQDDFDGIGTPEMLSERGRGLYLIKTFVDEVRVMNAPDGTEVVFKRKRISSRGERSA